jgi:hypothetical protein
LELLFKGLSGQTLSKPSQLTGRIYPSREDSNGFALYNAPGVSVQYEDIQVWET